MISPESKAPRPQAGWRALKHSVAAGLDQPIGTRESYLRGLCPDLAQRAEVARLIAACERAASSPVLESPAALFAAPVVEEVGDLDEGVPEELQAALAGRYRIEREAGRGGMGRVYLAHDERHGRSVALKLLGPGFMQEYGSAGRIRRFEREIEIAARLSHPHILPLFDSGTAGGLLYYITPFVDGETLRDRLTRTGPPPLTEAVRILHDVTRGLAHAHGRGVVHCDIKPANILLNEDGDALVADFGVARGLSEAWSPTGEAASAPPEGTLMIGTPAYMAPEQAIRGAGVDHRADLYALGAVAYELLTGTPPFAGRRRLEQLAAGAAEAPTPVATQGRGIPTVLAQLVDGLLSPQPDDRPDDASEVLRILTSVLEMPGVAGSGAARGRSSRRLVRRPLVVVPAAAALLLMAWTALGQRASPVGAGSGDEASIAVLTFEGGSESLDDAAIAEGLTDALVRRLGSVPGLRVAGRTAVSALERGGVDLHAIGDSLRVATVMTGTIRRADERLRVEASLLRARDRSILWAERYDVPAEDLLALRERVARDVATAMATRAAWGPLPSRPSERDTEDPEAYELYLKGRYLMNTRQRDGLLRAVSYFEDAIDRDSSYARAYAGSADAWTFLGIFNHVPPREGLSNARAAAERAVALDSLLVEAHATLAHLLFVYEWNWSAAEAALQRAVALDPRYALLRMYYASFLHSVGRSEEALAQLAVAKELDPLILTGVFSGRIYADTNRPDSAIRILEEEVELEPRLDLGHQILAHAYLQKGMAAEAVESMERAAALSGPRDRAQLAYVHAKIGNEAEARRIIAEVLQGPRAPGTLGFHLAMAYAGLGEADEAFRSLEAAYLEHASFMNLLGVATGFEDLRSDPRFDELLRRMGLR